MGHVTETHSLRLDRIVCRAFLSSGHSVASTQTCLYIIIVLIAIVFVSCTTYAYIRMRKLNGCQGYVAMIDLRPMGHKTDAITSDLLVNVYIIL
jgi:hypothetical protein